MQSALTRRFMFGLPMGLLVPGAAAASPWPSFQADLRPQQSTSRHSATLPDDVRIAPPRRDTPEPQRSASGRWEGWAGRNARHSIAVAIEDVNATGARGRYAYASDEEPSRHWPVSFIAIGGELQGRLPGGNTLTLRPRLDGHMDFRWERADWAMWVTGLLTRVAG